MLETTLKPLSRGDSRTYSVTFKDRYGVACDITGWTVVFTVKENEEAAAALVTKTTSTHAEPLTGVALIPLVPADTASLDVQGYWFTIRVTTNTGAVYTVVKGVLPLENN